MRHALPVLMLLAVSGACGCTTGPIPVRNLSRDPAVGSAETPYQFRSQRSSFSRSSTSGMIMPDPGADQMPQSRNSLPSPQP